MKIDMEYERHMIAYSTFVAQFEYAKEKGDVRCMDRIIMRMLVNGYSIKDVADATKVPRKQIMAYSDHIARLDYIRDLLLKGAYKDGLLKAAKNMFKDGLDLALIKRYTGLPKKQIMALR